MKDVFPPHIVYRQGRMNRIRNLIGKVVNEQTFPEPGLLIRWTLGEILRCTNLLATPQSASQLIHAIDDEYRGDPVSTIDMGWEQIVAIRGDEPVEDGTLDWGNYE